MREYSEMLTVQCLFPRGNVDQIVWDEKEREQRVGDCRGAVQGGAFLSQTGVVDLVQLSGGEGRNLAGKGGVCSSQVSLEQSVGCLTITAGIPSTFLMLTQSSQEH